MRRRRHDRKLAWLEQALPLPDLSRRELDALGAAADRANVRPGTVIARQGEIGREAFLVVDGEVEIIRDGVPVARLGAGEIVGELALLGDWYRTADIVAVTDVEVVVFDVRSFGTALQASPGLRRHVDAAAEAHTAA
jgi:CRP/FNR family transcriptional regulator, cyclic AMP receptor protein